MPQSKQQKRQNAMEMAEANAKLTPEQKIAKLDHLLGPGNGAVRERARLARQIEERKAKVSAPTLDSANPEGSGKLSQEEKRNKRAMKDAEIAKTVMAKQHGVDKVAEVIVDNARKAA